MLTTCSFASTQWKSLMRLLDTHAPRELKMLSASFQNHLVQQSLHEKLEEPSHGVASQRSARGISVQNTEASSSRVKILSSASGNSLRSWGHERANLDDLWEKVRQETKKRQKQTLRRKLPLKPRGEIRKDDSPLFYRTAENISMREMMEFNFPNVQYIFGSLVT